MVGRRCGEWYREQEVGKEGAGRMRRGSKGDEREVDDGRGKVSVMGEGRFKVCLA